MSNGESPSQGILLTHNSLKRYFTWIVIDASTPKESKIFPTTCKRKRFCIPIVRQSSAVFPAIPRTFVKSDLKLTELCCCASNPSRFHRSNQVAFIGNPFP
ncbi:hypothetical protein NPIL_366831 [Nephila pilipes]|uniref:Uncharacterized protein n=1 Tax=Nephila pilipes TaxID=299642 RepID=A0A8X6PCL6_NEPPI|nr:hypothetical protein NPIL_366831 [Nephila pilipes]